MLWSTQDFTSTSISQWNAAYNWGNHANAGYLTSYTQTDGGRVKTNIGQYGSVNVDHTTNDWAGYAINSAHVFMGYSTNEWGIYNDTDNEWYINGYRNDRVDIMFNGGWRVRTTAGGANINGGLGVSGNLSVTGTLSGSGYNKTNWDNTYNNFNTFSSNNSTLRTDSRNSRGVTRLYRRDSDSDYSVQTYWTGSHWHLRGYSGDSFHAECRVAYADSAGTASSASSVAWSNVTGKPTIPTNNNQLTNGAGYITSTPAGLTSSSWLRTTGAHGWYSNTYAGGIYMEDSTWVRIYNGKQFYVSNSGSQAIATPGDVVAGYSDIRLKDVEEVENDALTKISSLDSIYYRDNEKARELGYSGSERKYGLIAQQVQEVLPEVIKRAPVDMDAEGGSKSGEDYITVDYDRVVPLLVAGIKEQTALIENLTSELESVKLELKELRDGSSK